MERLPTSPIYKVALSFIGILCILVFGLFFLQRKLRPRSTPEITPPSSPLLEVEFESGELVQKMRSEQLKELHTDSKSGMSIEHAFDLLLKKEKAK